ncbi:MAG TPA: hypothetical protein VGJ01_13425 [Pseudolabrys sp.]|jgi:hypothetical protein
MVMKKSGAGRQSKEHELVATRLLGAQLQLEVDGLPQTVAIRLDSTKGRHCINFSFLESMLLLSLLRCIQLDTGIELPDDPREVIRCKLID